MTMFPDREEAEPETHPAPLPTFLEGRMQLANIRKTCFALAVGTLCAGAQAALITDYTVTISGSAAANGTTQAFGPTSASLGSGLVDGAALGWDGEFSGSNARANVGEQGAFAAEVGGWGKFSSSATITSNFTFTNDSSSASAFTLRLMLNRARMFVDMDRGTGEAGFGMQISMDGSSIYDQSARFLSDGSYSQGLGTDFLVTQWEENGYNGSKKTVFQWSDTYLDIDLGVLAANQSVTINYDFISYAFGDYAEDYACYYFSYGCGTGMGPGDPFDIHDRKPFEILAGDPQPPSDVPEPASIWLGVTGLVGLVAMRRRKRPT